MAYTWRTDPVAARRIDRDLAHVVRSVREADPRLRSLVLTGGFARGEGATLRGIPQNDYDFVAIRSIGRPRTSYGDVQRGLERELGMHIDLAPVGEWRLPHVGRTIFWYETALEGRVLWGRNLLHRIPARSPREIEPTEPLRLLTNRAAGLLLSIASTEPDELRLQAAKALLAGLDATLLAHGIFPPRQAQRHATLSQLPADHPVSVALRDARPWIDWALSFKLDPESTSPPKGERAWEAAARCVVGAIPLALRHAGFQSLGDAARRDSWIDRAVFLLRGRHLRNVNPLGAHPTARVRAATLALLEASLDGHLRPAAARPFLDGLAQLGEDPLARLADLRRATRQ